MDDDLPSNFDVIILGTGMPESILAAAAARIGKTVLHLDRNHYYGGSWANFNFDQLTEWTEKHKVIPPHETTTSLIDERWAECLTEEETAVPLPQYPKNIQNVSCITCIRESASAKSVPEEKVFSQDDLEKTNVIPSGNENSENTEISHLAASSGDSFSPTDNEQVAEAVGETELSGITHNLQESESSRVTFLGASTSRTNDVSNQEGNGDHVTREHQEEDTISPDLGQSLEEALFGSNTSSDNTLIQNVGEREDSVNDVLEDRNHNIRSEESAEMCHDLNLEPSKPDKKEWTLEDLHTQRRKFNLDLAPKLLLSKGPLVGLLISSNIARYAEFKCATRVLTYINNHLEQVPCSRADVFATKHVSVVEKRMLMKLLTFCLQFQKHPEEYRGFEGRPFVEFLKSRKLTPSVVHYICYAIAMVDDSVPTLQGLTATQKFLESLGHYGNSPFLWPLYGCGELPQCFCRLCAVFGGIYYLKRSVEGVILDREGKCVGIFSNHKRINCSWLVMESSYAAAEFLPANVPERVSRAIFITSSSILPAEKEQLTLLKLVPDGNIPSTVTVLELGPGAMVCPDGLYVVYMNCPSVHETAKEDLLPAAELLFSPLNTDVNTGCAGSSDVMEPEVLWCVFFNELDTTTVNLNEHNPSGTIITSSPGKSLDYELTVKEARNLFQKMFPAEEFLPRAPDPEEIVMEGDTGNPGEKGNESAENLTDNEIQHPSENLQQPEELQSPNDQENKEQDQHSVTEA
ncbi:rab proteins geranylgeranyltransferase component A 2-like [Limulus polyphemus]|uniref:Rab proteins geranylgeranyltransferase component A 2-like n=1 Tax=Limulus polyphemus TaxID=6850 RepID=A0ABM1BCC7_LIMPO|nr:rab proteins geranylgeranyltransferase component A 2-like [Limulus polyphemus]